MEQRQQKREGVICFLEKEERYLLALVEYAETNRKWNGVGGFINEDESITDAVVRHMQEQLSVVIEKKDLNYRARIIEHNDLILHIFFVDKWTGQLKTVESSIKQIQWFTSNQIPYDAMWPDNTYWLPEILSGKKIIASILRDVYMDIKPLSERDVEIEEVADLLN